MRSQIKTFDNIFTFQRHICHKMTSKEVDKCCACKFPIKNNLHIALGLKWHRNCFRCSECLCTDPSHYIASDNVLYCKKDYVLKFGEHCQRCKEQITGPVMVAGDQKYHTECFVCTKCLKFIGYDDDYMLVERHNLYCNDCYKSSVLPAISTPVGKLGHCHTIQHINLTPTPVGRRKFSVLIEKANDIHKFLRSANPIIAQNGERRSYIAIDNVDASSELKARGVQSGDKVLEVNDIMVTDATVDKLSHIISNPQRVQTLTIERNNAVKQPFNSDIKISKKKEVLPSAILRSPVDRQSSLDLIGSPDYDQKYKKHLMPWDEDTEDGYVINGQRKTRKKPERANSLPRSNSTDNNNVMKCNSVLHRSHSVRTSVGQVFRPCDLILGEVIGKGFFGQVSKVVHRGTGKVMVLKELVRCDVGAQKQFVKEVTLLKTLDHPNVLKFIGILYKNKVLSFIAEYIAGGTLRGILKDQTRNLSWSQRVKFAKDIALGMDYLHKMNIIHRDLKSKNCLVRKDEGMTIVVADFGLAGILSIDEEENGTVQDQNNNGNKSLNHVQTRHMAPKKRTTMVGSPYWMAPEMLHGNAYDERVDIFSFGIIVCEIISRVKASPDFIPRTKTFGLDESSFEEKFCSDCPKAFYRIACLSCDMNPSDRPTFASLSYWLEALLVHLEVGMTLPNDVSSILLSSKSKKK